ncbi:MAG: hypothetical protein JWO89_3090 [Verrucomicrobiaceae bacterium]|nr:hypothetical protein [Verrucomicrobiaceae bacterium]
MTAMPKAQNGYVDHPRYGSAPRFTGVDADLHSADVKLRYRTLVYNHPMRAFMKRYGHGIPVPDETTPVIIPGTAIVADLSKQAPATVHVTHYYDEEHRCEDCGRLFLFFAEEQRFWYEERQFPLDADCRRCYPCRRKLQDIEQIKRQYEVLMAVAEPSADEEAQLAVARLALVKAGHFHFSADREGFSILETSSRS